MGDKWLLWLPVVSWLPLVLRLYSIDPSKLFYGALLLAILVGVVAFVYRVQIVHRLRPATR